MKQVCQTSEKRSVKFMTNALGIYTI